MSSYAQLDDLEKILSDGYGWDFEDVRGTLRRHRRRALDRRCLPAVFLG